MKIEKIKKVGNKYKIFFNNNEILDTYDEVILNNNILYKKEFDDELIFKIKNETKYYDLYNKALKYINTKLRCEYQVVIYLKKQAVDEKDIETIIKQLKEKRLINDSLFVKAYVHDRLCFSSDGPYKIRKNLIDYKIDEHIIDEELNSIDKNVYLDKLKSQLTSKINKNKKYSNNMLKQKLVNYFVNLGYDRHDIFDVINCEEVNDSSIIKNEYDKLYNKFKNKYDDERLKYVIKNKLYCKGFKMEDINNIINF